VRAFAVALVVFIVLPLRWSEFGLKSRSGLTHRGNRFFEFKEVMARVVGLHFQLNLVV
jgi:hypothetical protein